MRKKAQEEKRAAMVPSQTSSSSHSSISSNNIHAVDSHASKKAGEESFYDTGGPNSTDVKVKVGEGKEGSEEGFSMDDIWKDIVLPEENILQPVVYDGNNEEGCNFSCPPVPSPSWEYSSDPLWVMDEESMLFPISDPYFSCYAQGCAYLTG